MKKLNIREFLRTSTGKKIEKYLWEVAVLTISLVITIGNDMNIGVLIFVTPALFQLTKYINLRYIK